MEVVRYSSTGGCGRRWLRCSEPRWTCSISAKGRLPYCQSAQRLVGQSTVKAAAFDQQKDPTAR